MTSTMLLMVLLSVVLFLIFGYLLGNALVLGLFSILGFRVFSGKPRKDLSFIRKTNLAVRGIVVIPNVLYVPIFEGDVFDYKYKDYRGNIGGNGEVVVDNTNLGKTLRQLSGMESKDLFGDLCMLRGRINTTTYKGVVSNFTSLIRYSKTELRKLSSVIYLHDDTKVRKFELVFATELFVEDMSKLSASNRTDFISVIRKNAFYDTTKDTDSNIIILNGYTEIDSLLLVFKELR